MWQRPASPMWCSSAFLVTQALWGQGITSIGVIYYIASTLLFWTVGIWLLRKDGKSEAAREGSALAGLKKLASPPIIGMALGMAAVFFEIQVPDFVLKPLSMISQVTSPLALVFIGSVIRNMDLKTITLGPGPLRGPGHAVCGGACGLRGIFKSGSDAEGDERGIFHAVLHAGHGPDGHYGQTV